MVIYNCCKRKLEITLLYNSFFFFLCFFLLSFTFPLLSYLKKGKGRNIKERKRNWHGITLFKLYCTLDSHWQLIEGPKVLQWHQQQSGKIEPCCTDNVSCLSASLVQMEEVWHDFWVQASSTFSNFCTPPPNFANRAMNLHNKLWQGRTWFISASFTCLLTKMK